MLNKISISIVASSPIFKRVYDIYAQKINGLGIYAHKTKEITLFEVGGHNYYESIAKIAKLSENNNGLVIILTGLSETQDYFKEDEYINLLKKINVKKFLLPILGHDKLLELISKQIN